MTQTITKRTPALLVLTLFLSSCASAPQRTTMAHIQQSVEEGLAQEQGAPQPPPEVAQALLPPIVLNVPGADEQATEQRFDVKVRGARARDFFLSLVEGTPYNLVVHPDVSGSISLDLKNVTVPEVMETVRNVYGYDYKRTAVGFHVFPNTIHTRLYHVDYLAVVRTGDSEMRTTNGQISALGGSGESRGQAGAAPEGGERVVGVGSLIATRSEADFWRQLQQSLQMLVGAGEGRGVAVNPQTGVVMARALPDELRAIEEYLEASQTIAQRQVILEARILEVELSEGYQAGINWAAIGSRNGDTVQAGVFGSSTVFDSGRSNLGNRSNLLNPDDLATTRADVATGFGGVFALALDVSNFTAFIELLKRQGEVQVLSSPRVSTVNNQKAVIKVGADEFFVTDVTTNTTTATATTQNVSVELTPFFSGVALDVTPQIGADGDVVLHIHPAVSEVREQVKNITTTAGTLIMPLAASRIRETDTIIRARNGQIVVIGGLMQDSTRDEKFSVPVLGDLPLIGPLFRHTRQTKQKSELVILLKPTLVENSGWQWAQQLGRASGRFRGLAEGWQ